MRSIKSIKINDYNPWYRSFIYPDKFVAINELISHFKAQWGVYSINWKLIKWSLEFMSSDTKISWHNFRTAGILDSVLEKNTSHISYCGTVQSVWQEMNFVLDFLEAHVSLSPSLACREKTNQGRAAVCVAISEPKSRGSSSRYRNTFEGTYTSSSPFLAFGVRMRMRGVSFKASQMEDLIAHRYDFTSFSSVIRCLKPMRPLSYSRLVTSDWSCITQSQNRILFSFWEGEGGGSLSLF